MTQRILIPLDGSKLGETALHHVVKLLQELQPGKNIEITLLHIITAEKPIIGDAVAVAEVVPPDEGDIEEMRDQARGYLNTAKEMLMSTGSTVTCSVVVGDNPAEEIIKAEAELKVDLVVMSTHGRSGISRWALGSVADKVLRKGNIPVLLVRARK